MTKTKQPHTPNSETHQCVQKHEISTLIEDVNNIKTLWGYKDKYNGEFKQELITDRRMLTDKLNSFESSISSTESQLKLLLRIIAIGFPMIFGLLIELLLRL